MLSLMLCALSLGANKLRVARTRFKLKGLVQIHHVIPRQFSNHPALENFNVDAENNLIFMPTVRGAQQMHLRPDRLIHDGGHSQYNRYVGRYLEEVSHLPSMLRDRRINDTVDNLRSEMRRHTFVPWT